MGLLYAKACKDANLRRELGRQCKGIGRVDPPNPSIGIRVSVAFPGTACHSPPWSRAAKILPMTAEGEML
jgi:hypothetical protein